MAIIFDEVTAEVQPPPAPLTPQAESEPKDEREPSPHVLRRQLSLAAERAARLQPH